VKGSITARGRLEILSTGRVWADIAVTSFLIDEGGFFRGKSIMASELESSLEAALPTGETDKDVNEETAKGS
jgi:cytoskeletal protein CcmA (bactofilin family)